MEELSDVEAKHKRVIEPLVTRRAELERELWALNHELADAAVKARSDAVNMTMLGRWLAKVDFTKGEPGEGEMRPITRQAVDQLVAKHENRPRQRDRPAERKARKQKKAQPKPENNGRKSTINLEALV